MHRRQIDPLGRSRRHRRSNAAAILATASKVRAAPRRAVGKASFGGPKSEGYAMSIAPSPETDRPQALTHFRRRADQSPEAPPAAAPIDRS